MKKGKSLTDKEITELKKGPTDKVNPYKKDGFLGRIPFSIKCLFLKWWSFGVGIFFIFMGTANLIGSSEDAVGNGGITLLMILLSLFNGIVTDVVVYHLIYLMDDDTNKTKKYVMFHNKKWYSLFINIFYSFILTYVCVVIFENFAALLAINGITSILGFSIAIEPIFTGLLFLGVDMLFILLKNLIVKFYKKIKKGENNV